MLNSDTRRKLLRTLDTLEVAVWLKRMDDHMLDNTEVGASVRTVVMILQQMRYDNAINNSEELKEIRLGDVSRSAANLPAKYRAGYTGCGAMGPIPISDVEVEFATETVLDALREHHGFDLKVVGTGTLLRSVWLSATLPALRDAVRGVLETRDAANF